MQLVTRPSRLWCTRSSVGKRTTSIAWSWTPTPTGTSLSVSTPRGPSTMAGPIPERIRIAGGCTAPALTRATPPVVGPVAEVVLVLEVDEGRQDVLEGPACRPKLGPAVVVGRDAADRAEPVDGRAAAHPPAAHVVVGLLRRSPAGGEPGPP